jgi:hypothetical protein
MIFSGFDNMSNTGEIPLSYQKLNGTCTLKTTSADKLRIEIPINIKKALRPTACISNSLVMVFAVPHLDRLLITHTY